MNFVVHYEDESGPKTYNISVMRKDELDKVLKSFKDRTGLKDDQFTIEVVTANI